MSLPRISRSRALLLIALLAVGGGSIVVGARVLRPTRSAPTTDAARPRMLRVESLGRTAAAVAPKPLAVPRAAAGSVTAPLARAPKVVVPLEDTAESRESVRPERRSAGASKDRVPFGSDETLKERDGVVGYSGS